MRQVLDLSGASETVIRPTEPAGSVYWRRRGEGEAFEIADRLEDLCATPRVGEVDVPAVMAMALGARCLPGRTHLRHIGRVPPASTAWFSVDGVVLRSNASCVETLADESARSSTLVARRVRDAIRRLPELRSPDNVLIAHGGGLGSRYLVNQCQTADTGTVGWITIDESGIDGSAGNGRRTGTGHAHSSTGSSIASVDSLREALPASWPPLWPRQLPACLTLAAAADADIPVVVTGHGLHGLLSASPAELAKVRPGRWTGEFPVTHRPQRPPTRHSHQDPATATTPDGIWSWLTTDAAEQIRTVAAASHTAWLTWTAGTDPRSSAVLQAWSDLGAAWLHDTARHLGLRLVMPAWHPEILTATLNTAPVPVRVHVEHGLIVNAPLLRIAREPGMRVVGGDYRSRRAAARWAAGPSGAKSLERLGNGYLVDTGVLDRVGLWRTVEDPVARTQHALALRRLCDLDSWLRGLA